ncbi:hypothetical protein ACFOYU_12850 [Microvirga sp. GCM10011540]|uniref:hypothetical protein n=1 Tax=Microvirga sp. GCM10011540 TaxID=3317338 RepID=UPI00360BF706
MTITSNSVLFITLDSCRFDTFVAARAPAMKAVSNLFCAQAPSHFTYGSHAAMFIGFTPGTPSIAAPFINPKFARLFRLSRAGSAGHAPPGFELSGADIVDGFRNLGYRTIGTAAMGWFDPETPVSKKLTGSFEDFTFVGHRGLRRQLAWVDEKLATADPRDVFLFLNIGETHVPYHFEGAPWDASDNPCVPFQTIDRSADCRERQRLCCEYVDRLLAPLLDRFAGATILLCADHGDCWGEDGLWEHGISHPMTLTVPLLIRYRGKPVEALVGTSP